jgi:hypothetical protein
MPEPPVLPINTSPISAGAIRSDAMQDDGHDAWFRWSFLSLYAILLALVTSRFSMGLDEMRAWLLTRDSGSLATLFHYLHYEAHPSLWYLILYVPSRVSWNPIVMQAINYAFAVAEAWLILSARRVPWLFRLLAIFSFYGFYRYGVFPRNYMLATLLMTAAARCLLAERKKLGILFLALAINSHFFAIPIAFALALVYVPKLKSWKIASVILLVAVLLSYFTMRPAADVRWPYPNEHRSYVYYEVCAGSYAWQGLIPPFYLTNRIPWVNSFLHRTVVGLVLSAVLFLVISGALRTVRARCFFVLASALLVAAIGATIHRPAPQHLGMFFVVFVLSVLIDSNIVTTEHCWFSEKTASIALLAVLAMGSMAGLAASAYEWNHPYSYAKAVTTWFQEAGLERNPIVLTPDAPAILGYLQRRSAYYPACRCEASFLVLKVGWDSYRSVTEDELENLSRSSSLPVAVVTTQELPSGTLPSLRLKKLRAFSPISLDSGSVYVYQRAGP